MTDSNAPSMKLTQDMVAIGCNRVSGQGMDWSSSFDLVAYAAGPFVALYDVAGVRLVATCRGHAHDAQTSCVAWVRKAASAARPSRALLVSGATDTDVIVWEVDVETGKYAQVVRLTEHKAPVTSVRLVELADGEYRLYTAASDGQVLVWDASWQLVQDLGYGSIAQTLDVEMVEVRGAQVTVVAVGGVRSNVALYVGEGGGELREVLTLAGPRDWVMSVAMCRDDDGETVWLAAASQDTFVRLWRLGAALVEVELDADRSFVDAAGHIVQRRLGDGRVLQLTVALEAVLDGHENKVMCVVWHPRVGGRQPMRMLTASTDHTVMTWAPSSGDETWLNEVRLGVLGGHTMGMFGCCFSPDGTQILANEFSGALSRWVQRGDEDEWSAAQTVSGHGGAVMDIAWDKTGGYLLSTSSDQTTRVFAVVEDGKWLEVARPQVHGYDLTCVAVVPGRACQFVSAAEEKVMRVFLAPRPFLELMGVSVEDERVESVLVPELGLSNKAVEDGEVDAVQGVPSEEELRFATLWPEVEKLYGHGYEVKSLCCSHDGRFIASACTAKTPEHAVVRVWDTQTWTEVAQLGGHTLTVVDMAFSPDDRYLLTVSRDRHVALFENFELVWRVKAHKRIVWSCAWSPSGEVFATGSRDKTVKVWRDRDQCGQFKAKAAVTAVAWLGEERLVVGSEQGRVAVWELAEGEWRRACKVDAHAGTVKRLEWLGDGRLASCGVDGSVRVWNFV